MDSADLKKKKKKGLRRKESLRLQWRLAGSHWHLGRAVLSGTEGFSLFPRSVPPANEPWILPDQAGSPTATLKLELEAPGNPVGTLFFQFTLILTLL